MYDLGSGQAQQVAAHDAPIKCVKYVEVGGNGILITAGWDKKMKVGRMWEWGERQIVEGRASEGTRGEERGAMRGCRSATDWVARDGQQDRKEQDGDSARPKEAER